MDAEKVLHHNEFHVTIVVRLSNMAGDQVTRWVGKRQQGSEINDRTLTIMVLYR